MAMLYCQRWLLLLHLPGEVTSATAAMIVATTRIEGME